MVVIFYLIQFCIFARIFKIQIGTIPNSENMKIFRQLVFLALFSFPFLLNAQIVLNASTETVQPGQEVCVKVTVENFNNILTFQLSHNFDPSVIQFKEIRNFIFESASTPISLTFGTNNASEGIITMSWNTSDFVNGSSLADGTVIYEICFTAIGNDGQFSDFTFSDEPRAIEISDLANVLTVTKNDGRVNIGEVVGGGGFTISADDVVANMGGEVCVPIKVTGFSNIISVQHSIQFDPAALQYQDIQNFIFNSNLALTFGTQDAANGIITFVWTADDLVNGSSVDDGTKIYDLCFTAIGECETSSQIRLTEDPIVLEVSNTTETLDATLNDGTVSIGSCTYSVVLASALNPCSGQTNGSIDISVFGGNPAYSYLWSNGSTDEDISNLAPGTYNVTITDSDNNTVSLGQDVVLSDAPITISPTITDPSSSGATDGSITLNISNGSPDYSIQWDNGAQTSTRTNLGEGEYSVTVTDANSCTASLDITLSLGLKVVSTDINQIACSGEANGSIDISVGGGESPYSFAWSNGATTEDITDLPSGSYTVTITDNQSATFTGGPYEIVEPAAMTAEANITDVSDGANGAIDLTVSGGQPAYTYAWSNNATTQDINGLEAASYSVTVTDANGCQQVFTFDVPVEMFRVEFDVTDVSCGGDENGRIDATPQNGVAPFSFSWSEGSTTQSISGLSGGDYAVTVTDNTGNVFNGSVTVGEPTELQIAVDVTPPNGSQGGCADAIVQGGLAPYTFQWQPINQSTPKVCGLTEGQELVLAITDANGCQKVKDNIIIVIGECFESRKVITPNGDGKNDELFIQCATQNQNRIEIFDRWGQLIYEQANYDNTWRGTDLSGTDLADGVYFWVLTVTLPNNDKRVYKNSVTLLRRLN